MQTYDVFKWETNEYRVLKYEDKNNRRELQQVYTVKVDASGYCDCTCMSGRIRGYCKHMTWIKIITRKLVAMQLPPFTQHVNSNVQYQKQEAMKAITELKERKLLERSKK